MGPSGGGFMVSPYLRKILEARRSVADKAYEAEQAKVAADDDTRAEMGRAAEELAQVQMPSSRLPGADNPFWAKPREYYAQEPPAKRYREVPHSIGNSGPAVNEYVPPKRSAEEQARLDAKLADADPNVQEAKERDLRMSRLTRFGLDSEPLSTDPDAPTKTHWWKGIR